MKFFECKISVIIFFAYMMIACFLESLEYAYVLNRNSNNVSVIDVATDQLITSITVGTTPVAIAITPDGKVAYVVNQGSNNVSAMYAQRL